MQTIVNDVGSVCLSSVCRSSPLQCAKMSVRVLGATTTDAGVLPRQQSVPSVPVYHTVRQHANRLLQPLATSVGDILVLYIMLQSPFFPFVPVCIFP